MFERSGFYFFTLRDIDVAISPWYLILMAFIMFSPAFMSETMFAEGALHGIVFAVAVTLSLLVHEFGHGFVSQYYSLSPSILLHGFGGLCSHRPAQSDADDARILFAGPLAGLIFGAVAVAVQMYVAPLVPGKWFFVFVQDLVFINIAWSLINLLLPLYPLDGGKLFHLLLRRFTDADSAQRSTLNVSIVFAAIAVGVGLLLMGSLFIALLGFFILWGNWQLLNSGQKLIQRSSGREETSEFHEDMLERISDHAERDDWQEAYRLCHQLRSTGGTLPTSVRDEVFAFLALSSAQTGHLDEAEGYFRRAPDGDPRVAEAREIVEKGE
jgi:hypothetical protein